MDKVVNVGDWEPRLFFAPLFFRDAITGRFVFFPEGIVMQRYRNGQREYTDRPLTDDEWWDRQW